MFPQLRGCKRTHSSCPHTHVPNFLGDYLHLSATFCVARAEKPPALRFEELCGNQPLTCHALLAGRRKQAPRQGTRSNQEKPRKSGHQFAPCALPSPRSWLPPNRKLSCQIRRRELPFHCVTRVIHNFALREIVTLTK